MTKICFLLGGFQGNGGIGRVTSILVNQLCDDENLEIHTISYLQDQRSMLYDIKPAIHSHVLYTSPCSMAKAMALNHAVQKVSTILREEKIDLLIACGALYFPLGIMACKTTYAKCICWEHTNPETSSDYKFQNFCRRFAVKRCSHMVVLTKSAEQYYMHKYPACQNKITQIYNPIAEGAAKSAQYDCSSQKIISVGRLSYPKNFERLISIAARILPEYPDWSWDIYGDGELKNSLQDLIDEKKLSTQLTLKGQVSDLYNRYGDYSFMVMTSRYEGFPMSLIEGAANRLPLISFDIPTGPNEIISDGVNGYLIDPNDDNEMVKKIRYLMANPGTRTKMSDKVYRLTNSFALERILEQWKMLYSKLK